MNLASNTKLLTSVAALATLGGGFRWRTAVYADDLDDDDRQGRRRSLRPRPRRSDAVGERPARSSPPTSPRAACARSTASSSSTARYFDDVTEPPHYDEQPNERAGFRAPIAELRRRAQRGHGHRRSAEPGGRRDGHARSRRRRLRRVAQGTRSRRSPRATRAIRVDAKPKADHLAIEVTGQIRAADGSYDARKRVDDPARFAGEGVRASARRAQASRSRSGRSAAARCRRPRSSLASHDSAPLVDVMRDDEQGERQLHRRERAEDARRRDPHDARPGDVGRRHRPRCARTLAQARPACRQLSRRQRLGPVRRERGLARTSSSRCCAPRTRTSGSGPTCVASLPIGGVDGTLAKRWHGSSGARPRAREDRHARQGDHRSPATSASTSGHPLAFAILVNDIPAGQRAAARAMADDMIDAMVAYLEAP